MRLRRSDLSAEGVRRRRRGKGFSYEFCGAPITDAQMLARIRALVIPPAWREVWICPDPGGHIQAVGVDAAARKQYLYHEKWRTKRDAEKFAHMLVVAAALPRLRQRVAVDLGARGLTQVRVLAAQAMRDTAELLGNTPSIARKSYVDPHVTELYRNGVTISPDDAADRHRAERAVLKLLS